MGHYDCRKCGEWGCTESDCMSAEKVEKRKEEIYSKRVEEASNLLAQKVREIRMYSEALQLVKEAGVYNPSIHDINLTEV